MWRHLSNNVVLVVAQVLTLCAPRRPHILQTTACFHAPYMWLWAGSFSRSEVLSYLYLPSSFKLFLSLFLLVIQLAKEIVLDLIGRIKAPDPWKGHTSRCHLGYIYTDPQMTVKAYPHTTVWVPIGCSTVLG